YTGIRIRGSDGSRINTTINGIALNDAESQISYFVDVPDLLSSVDNIQIQRGVGTSTNGSGAFGGSINIETSKLSVEPYATYSSSAGSFATFKNTLNLGSGLLANAYSFDVRLSKISSDGYIDRGASNLLAYYLSGGYYGKNSTLKFISFGGTEKTYQCWNGVPEAKLFGDSTALADYIQRNYLSESAAQNLLQSSARTFNSFTYTNQTDNYKQLNYQLHFSQRIKNYWNASVALHYTKGLGYYEEYKEGVSFTDYNLQNVVLTNDTVYTTNLVRQKWLSNDYYGITYSLNYSRSKKFFATLGGAYSIYDGDHYTKLIWANYFSNADLNKKYNFSNGLKNDYNIYVKANYQINRLINAFADVQFRKVTYSYPGFTTSLEIEKQKARLNFFNPKVGLSYFITSNKLLYLSYSIANKEPSRDDFTQASSTSVPAPEKLMNWELGYVQKNKRYSYSFNTYLMNYINQLVLNGEVNDVGAYNRTNVNKSHRLGIEYTTAIQLFKKLEWSANATWSSNKINQFYEFVDNYDSSYQEVIEHRNTDISFSPDWVAASTLSYTPIKNLTAVFSSKYVGKQYLDNTSSADRMLDAYWVNDLRLNYSLHQKQVKEILFTLSLNNLFNEQYESNGYTYNYISNGKLVVENFYFPQAGFNFMAGATLKF
ncbi:MAG TPA: TonB-dependent receptor, partial [Bacteroidia bacterium]|nr:TonB-dependent receptor [Bacteroidia bacterium]